MIRYYSELNNKYIYFKEVVCAVFMIICFIFIFPKCEFGKLVTVDADGIKSEITSENVITSKGIIKNTVSYSNGTSSTHTYGIGANSSIYTTDQMTDYFLRKGNEIISLLQILAQPFCIILFVIGCGRTLIGYFIGTCKGYKGLILMGGSAIAYVLILYAPVIVVSGVTFLAN